MSYKLDILLCIILSWWWTGWSRLVRRRWRTSTTDSGSSQNKSGPGKFTLLKSLQSRQYEMMCLQLRQQHDWAVQFELARGYPDFKKTVITDSKVLFVVKWLLFYTVKNKY